ncbi:protein FAR1-RELATED SEQUENCE 5-like isoform X2 [Magnolia sinica]|uniref:protein FAR1-RELATED SEQUENCE 5-like isoform X2 n=1 Tax=Magnolia sinica TaxID=86752 RepID=UPI00265AC668|nr:protein FAR1-RELATED SEQUENCE 5-like isoform X2 [Magnolia sinica]
MKERAARLYREPNPQEEEEEEEEEEEDDEDDDDDGDDEDEEEDDRKENLNLTVVGHERNPMETTPNQYHLLNRSHSSSEDVGTDAGEDNKTMDNSLGRELIVSQGISNLEPRVGMEFDSEEAARIFYNAYARRVGFSIRASDFYRSKRTGKLTSRKFVCAREGFHKRKDMLKRPRASNREGCKASMQVKKQDSGKWVIVKVLKDHNHELAASKKVHSLRSHRHLYHAAKSLVESFEEAEVASGRTRSMSREKSHFTERDCGKSIRSGQQSSLGRDAQNLLDYFKRVQAENPAFFYAIQVDECQCMRNVFWADARSRMAYKYFGDVVNLDMTYKMNQYRLSFVSFTGVNHHLQTVLFGCALLTDESESSFVWLFNTWVAAMSRRHPNTIVTNRDKCVRAAIARVLQGTRHCFCKWHVIREVLEKVSPVFHAHRNFEPELNKCINLTETIDEFELSWGSLLNRYNLGENEWLQSLYDVRRQWVPVYLRDTFFAQVSTTHQNENINSFFDGYVNAQTTLQEFLRQYEKALESCYQKEVEADMETIHTKPFLKTASPIERQAAGLYTRKIFMKFQEELFETCAYIADKFEEDGAVNLYKVAKFGEDHKACTVAFNISELMASCSCRMFESSGILCRHVLTVFRVVNVLSLPSHYIWKRWTRNAKSGIALDERGTERESLTLRYNSLFQGAIKLAEEGATSVDIYDVAVRALREALDKVAAAKNNVVRVVHQDTQAFENYHGDNTSEGSQAENTMDQISPEQIPKSKGITLNSRFKPGLEKAIRKTRTCVICNQSNHNCRICPKLKVIGSKAIGDSEMGHSSRGVSYIVGQSSTQDSCTKSCRDA